MHTAKVNGLDIAWDSFGEGEGEPLILVMGLGAQLVFWDPDFCRMLVDRGFRVIRFDNRDAGRSSRIAAPAPPLHTTIGRWMLGLPIPAPYTLADMADDLTGLLDALGIESAHVVGVSMGGMIAQTAAIRHPARVRTLTSISSSTGDRIASIGQPRALAALLKQPPRTREEVAAHTVALFRVIGSPGFPLDEERLRRIAFDAYDRSVNPPGFARQMAAILASGSRSRALRQVQVPSLVIHGAADPLVPPIGGRLTARALPHSRLMMIEGMGHDLPRGAWPRIVGAIADLAQSRRAVQ